MKVTDVFPSRLPDLHVGRPVIVTGRYQGTPMGNLRVTGRAGGKRLSYQVSLGSDGSRTRPALAQIWARMRIADLADRATYEKDVRPLAVGIKKTALTFGIMSAYTAFVAVDSSEVTGGKDGGSVPVPVPVPEGVKYETTVSDRTPGP
jgi:Ca-activated chloride channel family protein